MTKQTYYYVVSGVFAVVALFQLARALGSWEAIIGGGIIPVWGSWAGFALAGYLSIRGYQFGKRM